jgi:uncharacterized membrane protein
MAGIGFKLRAFADEGTLTGLARGYLGAAFISTGPWIMTVLTLLLTAAVTQSVGADLQTFKVMMVYTYAFSLIMTGCFQHVVTRYLADRLYGGDIERHLPVFVGVCLSTIPFETLLAGAFYMTTGLTPLYKLMGTALFVVVSTIWMVMIFVGALQAYLQIVMAFLVGSAVTLLGTLALGPRWGEPGYMVGYVLGQAVILLVLLDVLLREFPLTESWRFDFLGYFRRHPFLALAGACFYLGAWIDKVVYWMSPVATHIGAFAAYPEYDMASFIGQLTVLPAMAFFFLRAETDFYEGYRAFYGGILRKAGYAELNRRKEQMISVLKTGFLDLLKLQGLITFIIAVQAHEIFYFLHMSDNGWHMLRIATVAAFAQVLFLFSNVLMFYYEAYREAALTSVLFLVVNTVVSILTIRWGPATHGLGLLVGALVALAVSSAILAHLLRHLEYFTFTRQPMPGQLEFNASMLAGKESFGQYIIKDGELQVKVHVPT